MNLAYHTFETKAYYATYMAIANQYRQRSDKELQLLDRIATVGETLFLHLSVVKNGFWSGEEIRIDKSDDLSLLESGSPDKGYDFLEIGSEGASSTGLFVIRRPPSCLALFFSFLDFAFA